jgi:amidase
LHEPSSWSSIEALEAHGPDALPKARAAIARAVRTYREAMSGFDVVLTPTLGREPCELGYLSPVLPRPVLLERTMYVLGYTPIHNIVGRPAMSVPLNWSEQRLPIAAHFATAPGRDALLLGWRTSWSERGPGNPAGHRIRFRRGSAVTSGGASVRRPLVAR